MFSLLPDLYQWKLVDSFPDALRLFYSEDRYWTPLPLDSFDGIPEWYHHRRTVLIGVLMVKVPIRRSTKTVLYMLGIDHNLYLCDDSEDLGDLELLKKNVKYAYYVSSDQIFYVTMDNILHILPKYSARNSPIISFSLPSGVREYFPVNRDNCTATLLTLDQQLYQVSPQGVKLLCPDRILWVDTMGGELYCTINDAVYHNDKLLGTFRSTIDGSFAKGRAIVMTEDRKFYIFKGQNLKKMVTGTLPPDTLCVVALPSSVNEYLIADVTYSESHIKILDTGRIIL